MKVITRDNQAGTKSRPPLGDITKLGIDLNPVGADGVDSHLDVVLQLGNLIKSTKNLTIQALQEAVIGGYNSEGQGGSDRREDLLNLGLDFAHLQAGWFRFMTNPDDAVRATDVEGKIRNREPLDEGEKVVAKNLFGPDNPAELDILNLGKLKQFYVLKAGEIAKALDLGRDSEEYMSISKEISEGGNFLNPLVMMFVDMMRDPKGYALGREDFDERLGDIADKYVLKYMKTSNPYMEVVMKEKPESWGEAVGKITQEKIHVYNDLCGLLGEKPLTADDVALALGPGVDASDVSAKARSEYSQGIELPDKIDNDFINYLAALDLADIPVESYALDLSPQEMTVLTPWRRREILEDINQRYVEREKEEAELQEEDSWDLAYITAKAMIEKMVLMKNDPPKLDALAELIYENKSKRKKMLSRGGSGFKTN